MQWLSFTKVEKVMLELQNGWIWTVQRCGRSWRSSRRLETPLTDKGAEENGVSALLNSSNPRGKSFDETLTESADPWPPPPLWTNPPCCRTSRRIRHPASGKPVKLLSLGFLVNYRGKDRHQTPKSAVFHGLSVQNRDQEVQSAFCALWSQIELPVLHRRHFRGLPADLDKKEIPKSFLVPAIRLCTLSGFKDYPVMDSEENPCIH